MIDGVFFAFGAHLPFRSSNQKLDSKAETQDNEDSTFSINICFCVIYGEWIECDACCPICKVKCWKVEVSTDGGDPSLHLFPPSW
jgi:hypothetical protein